MRKSNQSHKFVKRVDNNLDKYVVMGNIERVTLAQVEINV